MIEKRLKDFSKTQYKETAELTTPFFLGRGKKLRPLLTVLCSTFYKPFQEKTLDIAIASELIHTASLIHDDIVDEAKTRRGINTINHRLGNQMGVLTGDYLFAKAFELLAPFNSRKIFELMTCAVREMSQGEITQLKNLYNTNLTRQEYFDYIQKKTASLISACCQSGAIVGDAPEEKMELFCNFGTHLGRAFQIIDDMLDFTAKSSNMGKPTKKDLRQGILTLPVIHIIETKKEGQIVKNIIDKRELTQENLDIINELLHQNGSISFTYLQAKEEVDKAIEALNQRPDVNKEKSTLKEITYYILDRKE